MTTGMTEIGIETGIGIADTAVETTETETGDPRTIDALDRTRVFLLVPVQNEGKLLQQDPPQIRALPHHPPCLHHPRPQPLQPQLQIPTSLP